MVFGAYLRELDQLEDPIILPEIPIAYLNPI
jgi:hypothetical protein